VREARKSGRGRVGWARRDVGWSLSVATTPYRIIYTSTTLRCRASSSKYINMLTRENTTQCTPCTRDASLMYVHIRVPGDDTFKFQHDFWKTRHSRHRRYAHPIRTRRTRRGVVIDSEQPLYDAEWCAHMLS